MPAIIMNSMYVITLDCNPNSELVFILQTLSSCNILKLEIFQAQLYLTPNLIAYIAQVSSCVQNEVFSPQPSSFLHFTTLFWTQRALVFHGGVGGVASLLSYRNNPFSQKSFQNNSDVAGKKNTTPEVFTEYCLFDIKKIEWWLKKDTSITTCPGFFLRAFTFNLPPKASQVRSSS